MHIDVSKKRININELKAERADIRAKADTLTDAAIKAKKDLGGPELELFNMYAARLKAITADMDEYETARGMIVTPRLDGQQPSASNFRQLFANANAEQREQIGEIVAYLSGQIIAGADLRPSGDGGLLIPTFIQTALERNYSAFAPVVSVARLWPTDTGADQVFPVLSDSEAAEQVDAAATTGADATVTGDTPPTDLTGPTMKAYKISSKPVFVSRETFTDSPTNIIEEIVGALIARIIRKENALYTAGTGTGEAEGFTTNCTKYVAGAVPLDLDVALDLAYSVPALYRPQGVYMMSDTTARYLRKLKTGLSGDKRQLWADADATKGTPATLHGYPVSINNDMDSVATDGTFAAKIPVAFGDFSKFVVRQAEQGRPFAYRYQVPARDGSAVILFRRTDSRLLVPEAISKLVVS